MTNRISSFFTAGKWRTSRAGFSLVVFRIGKAISICVRFLLVVGLTLSVIACIVNPTLLYVLSFGAGPVLFFLALGEAVARTLMQLGGGQVVEAANG